MSAYWLGVATPFVVAAALVAVFVALVWSRDALRQRGYEIEAKTRRGIGKTSDYTLRHTIFWERSFGPVFAGGWYFENPRGVNRWVGLGRADGPCLMAFKLRKLDAL